MSSAKDFTHNALKVPPKYIIMHHHTDKILPAVTLFRRVRPVF